MKALTVTAPGRMELRQIPDPDTVDGRLALVAIERAGVCGTDLKIHRGAIPVHYPRVLGHELVGTVVESSNTGSIARGARVLVDPSVACGSCRQCRADRGNLCPNGALMGRDVDGGFAGLLAADEAQLHPVPPTLSADHAVMAQVLGVCVHAQARVPIFPGQTIVVIGLGVTGLLMVQLLRERGIDRLLGVTRSASKRELAAGFGATLTATPDGAPAAVAELTDGDGADLVIECVGSIPTFAQAIEFAGLGANVVLFGTATGTEGQLPFYELYRKELTVYNPRAALPRDYASAVDLLAGQRITVGELLSAAYPIDRGQEAFARLDTESGLLKILLEAGT